MTVYIEVLDDFRIERINSADMFPYKAQQPQLAENSNHLIATLLPDNDPMKSRAKDLNGLG